MDVQTILDACEAMLDDMHLHRDEWDELRLRIEPRFQKNAGLDGAEHGKSWKRHSHTANRSLKILAAAHITYIVAMGQKWLSLKPRGAERKSSRENDWFNKATESLLMAFSASNFYPAMHECCIDRCLTGTGCLFMEGDTKSKKISFRPIYTGTYGMAENAQGEIDSLVRVFRYTAHQAVLAFKYENLPDRIKQSWDDVKKRNSERFEFYHYVAPNPDYQFGAEDVPAARRKFTDIYVAVADKRVVYSGGFYEFPYMVTRFLKKGDCPWGEAPAAAVMAEILSSIKLDRVLDVRAEVSAFPRILTLAKQVGEIDLRAGGRTIITPEAAKLGFPREWAAGGDDRNALERRQLMDKAIEAAFYVDMLQVISSVDRQMTATEVNAREGEKVLIFSPSFTLFSNDMQPGVFRALALLHRMKQLPEGTPEDIIQRSADGKSYELILPNIRYLGKIPQALERAYRYNLEGSLRTLGEWVQLTGDNRILNRIDPAALLEFVWDADGSPFSILKDKEQVKEEEKQEQQLMQQAQEAALLEQLSKANKNNSQAQTP